VRISNDARRCVVFLGECHVEGDPAQFRPLASGFLIRRRALVWEPVYLVTAKHCLREFVGGDFWVRMNTEEGARVHWIESPDWIFHEDPNVDLALLEWPLPTDSRYCVPYSTDEIPSDPGSDDRSGSSCGPGDLTYMVGLFRTHRGRSKNIPLVHTGHIAAFSDDEKIEVEDWDNPEDETASRFIDAYIVQCLALEGSSGSPVFVRRAADTRDRDEKHTHNQRGEMHFSNSMFVREPPKAYGPVHLLGMWRSSWELLPSDRIGYTRIRYPTGYGTVVPGEKIIEVLEMPKQKAKREQAREEAKRKATKGIEKSVGDSLPSRRASKSAFDKILRRMLDTPPDPRVKNK
jgi:hypothetical protein